MTNHPRCPYCGTARPSSEPRCPRCGHAWIDQTIADAVASPAPVPATRPSAAPRTPEAPARTRPRWLFPVVITSAAVAVYAVVFVVLLQRTGDVDEPSPPVVAPTTTATVAPTTSAATTSVPTTIAPTTTSTTTTTTTTTTTQPPVPTIPPLGEPIPLEQLTLGAFALGPLTFGDENANALGRLVATLGQPDDVFAIGEADGLCPTETGRAARFGWLTALTRDEAGDEVLVGYRLEQPPSGEATDPTSELETISGAAIGDTLAEWNSIYGTSIVRTTDIDGTPHLLLLRSSDERTLLWGPLSTDDPPVVQGIFSPRPCDGGPFG